MDQEVNRKWDWARKKNMNIHSCPHPPEGNFFQFRLLRGSTISQNSATSWEPNVQTNEYLREYFPSSHKNVYWVNDLIDGGWITIASWPWPLAPISLGYDCLDGRCLVTTHVLDCDGIECLPVEDTWSFGNVDSRVRYQLFASQACT